jgi:hypothetical protein
MAQQSGTPVRPEELASSKTTGEVRTVRFRVERVLKGDAPHCLALDLPGATSGPIGSNNRSPADLIAVGDRIVSLMDAYDDVGVPMPLVASEMALVGPDGGFPTPGSHIADVDHWELSAAALASRYPSVAGESAGRPSNSKAAADEVTRHWERFFSETTDLDERARLLENGEGHRADLQRVVSSGATTGLSVEIRKVGFRSQTTAGVRYDILKAGQTLIWNLFGSAKLVSGTWKISESSYCDLTKETGLPVVTCP